MRPVAQLFHQGVQGQHRQDAAPLADHLPHRTRLRPAGARRMVHRSGGAGLRLRRSKPSDPRLHPTTGHHARHVAPPYRLARKWGPGRQRPRGLAGPRRHRWQFRLARPAPGG
ncbi:hypothetical protein G6F46_014928 [Rhizopus delemar]|nr:hypothetical protein G6F46_014928 [Rhizopus delemar]